MKRKKLVEYKKCVEKGNKFIIYSNIIIRPYNRVNIELTFLNSASTTGLGESVALTHGATEADVHEALGLAR